MKRVRRSVRVAVVAVAIVLAGAWAGAGAPRGATASAAPRPQAAPARPVPQGMTRVQQGAVVFTPSYIDVYVALARGLFAEQGLDVESTTFPDPGTASRAFVSGSLDFGNIGLDYMIRAAEQTNNNVAVVAGQEHRSTFALISTADAPTFDSLRGQVMAVVGPNDGTTLLLKRMLAANGLHDGDYDMQVVGGTPNRVAAMQAGVAKAGMIAPPAFFSLLDQGMNLLGRSADYVSEYAFSNHMVRRDWAERNHDTVVRYLAAIVKADRWIADPANKEQGIAILADATRTSPDAARRTWEYAIEQLDSHVHDGEVSLDGIAAIIEQLGSIGDLPQPLPSPDRYVDLRYLEEARQMVR
ncbi:MAG TPA: ABC transporter substrate-binding protein [Chloroflexota bacterium]|nr:ABC transporter substrate-binding protein [Chloroflexota bacterium]